MSRTEVDESSDKFERQQVDFHKGDLPVHFERMVERVLLSASSTVLFVHKQNSADGSAGLQAQ